MSNSTHTAAHKNLKVLLIGDNCVDVYNHCDITRWNPESSAPLVVVSNVTERPGMAANVLKCLDNLQLETTFLTSPQISIKTRYIDNRTGQQLLRVDDDPVCTAVDLDGVDVDKYDAIVISDYCKGSVPNSLIKDLQIKCTCPIFLDTKKHNLEDFGKCVIKINEHEYSKALGVPTGTIITKGANGAHMHNVPDTQVPALETSVVDVCGAGDAFLAGLVYGYSKETFLTNALKYGIVNAGIAVRHLGTYAPSLAELNKGLQEYARIR